MISIDMSSIRKPDYDEHNMKEIKSHAMYKFKKVCALWNTEATKLF